MTHRGPARLGGRIFPRTQWCLHCGAPIRTVNTSIGQQVEHYDPDASFRDSVWRHCRLTVATYPTAESGPSSDTSGCPVQTPTTADRDGSTPPPDDRDYSAFDYDLDERCEP